MFAADGPDFYEFPITGGNIVGYPVDFFNFTCPLGSFFTRIGGIDNTAWRYLGALGPNRCSDGTTFPRAGGPDGVPFEEISEEGFTRIMFAALTSITLYQYGDGFGSANQYGTWENEDSYTDMSCPYRMKVAGMAGYTWQPDSIPFDGTTYYPASVVRLGVLCRKTGEGLAL